MKLEIKYFMTTENKTKSWTSVKAPIFAFFGSPRSPQELTFMQLGGAWSPRSPRFLQPGPQSYSLHFASSTLLNNASPSPQAFEALEGLLTENNICIAVKEKLKKDSGVAKEAAYDSIVKRLLSKERAKGQFHANPRCEGCKGGCCIIELGQRHPNLTANAFAFIEDRRTVAIGRSVS